jgi:hypothetical protein
LGTVDGFNLYAYVSNDPVNMEDRNDSWGWPTWCKCWEESGNPRSTEDSLKVELVGGPDIGRGNNMNMVGNNYNPVGQGRTIEQARHQFNALREQMERTFERDQREIDAMQLRVQEMAEFAAGWERGNIPVPAIGPGPNEYVNSGRSVNETLSHTPSASEGSDDSDTSIMDPEHIDANDQNASQEVRVDVGIGESMINGTRLEVNNENNGPPQDHTEVAGIPAAPGEAGNSLTNFSEEDNLLNEGQALLRLQRIPIRNRIERKRKTRTKPRARCF